MRNLKGLLNFRARQKRKELIILQPPSYKIYDFHIFTVIYKTSCYLPLSLSLPLSPFLSRLPQLYLFLNQNIQCYLMIGDIFNKQLNNQTDYRNGCRTECDQKIVSGCHDCNSLNLGGNGVSYITL